MRIKPYKSMMVILIIITPILFSCAPISLGVITADSAFRSGSDRLEKGQFDQAISSFNRSLEIDPNFAPAYNSLAWLYATAKESRFHNGEKAVELALKACELSGWNDPDYLETLAAAYARMGDFNNALKWQEKALESPKKKNDAMARERLNFYKERLPWTIEPPYSAECEIISWYDVTGGRGTNHHLPKNKTNERKCYKMQLGSIVTEWDELPPLGRGKRSAYNEMDTSCAREVRDLKGGFSHFDFSACTRRFDGTLKLMPYPRVGSCLLYNGLIEVNNTNGLWYFDSEKVAALLQRPVGEVERALIEKGMLPFTERRHFSSATSQPSSPAISRALPSSTISDLEKGWRGLSWGMSLSEFKAKFPKHSQDATWWITGEGIEEFAGLWMKTRYGFNKHERLSTVQFLPSQEDRSRVVESLVGALGQPTGEKEGNRFWNLPSRNVFVAAMFGNGIVVIQHGPLAKD